MGKWENHGKSIGNPWENEKTKKSIGKPWENGGLPSGVIKHGWLDNLQKEWMLLARKIIDE